MKNTSTHYYRLLPFFLSLIFTGTAMAQGSTCLPVGNFIQLPLGPLPGAGSAFISKEYGSPIVTTEACDDPKSARIRATFNVFGDGLRYSTFAGANPQPTFMAGMTYNISFNAGISNSTSGSWDNVLLVAKAANNLQSGSNCTGSCLNLQEVTISDTSCQQTIFTFTPTQNYNNLVFTATADFVDTTETLWLKLDNICVIKESPPCDVAFTWVSDPCGNTQFFNNSDPAPESSVWHFTGPGLPPGGVDVGENDPVFSFPTSGTYTVTLNVLCTNGGTGTITQTITVVQDQVPPVFSNCPNFSLLIPRTAPDCDAPYTIPNVSAFDNNGLLMACNWNNTPVNPGQAVILAPGNHVFTCVAEDNCGNTSTCEFQVTVQCDTIDAPCDGYDDGSPDSWTIHNTYPNGLSSTGTANVVVGSPSITGNSNDYYLQFKDVSGSTWAVNNVDFNGNWTNYLGDCLCFDYKVENDGSQNNVLPVIPAIYITGPFNLSQPFAYGVNPQLMAEFKINTSITELDGWQSYCAPLDLCDSGGNLPSNTMGNWTMLAGSGCTDWASLLNNVGGIMFRLDFTSSPSEIVRVDNICIKDCCEMPPCDPGNLCDSIMVMVDSIPTPACFDPSIITGNPCPANFDPVCGCNGQTYSNACNAEEAGITTYVPGECSPNNPPPVPGGDCCYSIDLKIPDGLAYVCFDMLTPGVIFNSAMLTAAGFQLDTLANGTMICVSDNAPGRPHLTGGMYNDWLKFCLANVNDSTQNPQCVAVTFWQLNPVDIPVLVCSDTLKFNCAPPVSTADTCVAMEILNVVCDPENPNKYQMTFGVCNYSGFTASQVVLTSLDPNIKFLPCGFSFVPQPSIGVPLIPGLASGSCDNTLCVDIVSSVPITSAYTFCTQLTIWNSTMCCTSPAEACVTLVPCCEPCDQNGVVSSDVAGPGNCCHSLDLVNDCEIDFFTKVELVSATPGVNIGSHFTGGPNPLDWAVTKSTYNCVQWVHSSGFIPGGITPGLINFCLSDIDPTETPQIMYLNWYTTTINGDTIIACTDTLVYECAANDNGCVKIVDVQLNSDPCDPATTSLAYSVTLQNNSTPPHFATSLMMNSITPGVSVFPNNIIFPGLGLPYLGITTVNFNVFGTYSPGDIIKIEVRLHDSASGDDWCCFESDTLCLVIPECPDSCCVLTPAAFANLFNAGLNYTVDQCEVCFPFALDSCDLLTIQYGNGTTSTYQSGNTICQSYAPPGGTFAVHINWKRFNMAGEICLEKDTTIQIIVECPPTGDVCGSCPPGTVQSTNLVDNGDFSGGNTGFTSTYTYQNGGLLSTGSYDIRNSTNLVNGAWTATGHTTNTTLDPFMAIDGPAGGTAYSTDVNVINGVNYIFCAFVNNLVKPNGVLSTPTIEVTIDGNIVVPGTLIPQSPDQWVLLTANYTATTTGTVTITINDLSTSNFNDWAIDDVSLVSCTVPSACCDDYEQFQNLANQGWTIVYGDSCRVTVTMPQFDSCHWISHSEPNWGDGTPSLTIIVPATGTWSHQYAQPGTYNICATVYEGDFINGFCWDTTICSPVTVNCCLGNPCDSVDITAAPDPTSADTCCYIVTIDNHYCDSTYFKGLMIQTTLPTTISQISVLNGWIINQFNSTTAAVFPPGGGAGYVGQGVQDVFRICTDNYTINPHFVTVSWLIPSANGGVDIVCPKELAFDCAIPPAEVGCVQIVDDSINCETNTYCFKVKNNSTPGFNINQILLINLTPSTAVLTSNPVPIPLLTPGQTSGWICMTYSGVVAGDNLCFNTTAHFVDANGNALTCCTDTVVHCVPIPECGCCAISQTGFDSLLQNVVLHNLAGLCEVCLLYTVDSCDVLQIDFGDGATVSQSGNGEECHTYATPGSYSVTLTLVRYDDNGDTCRFAQTELPVTVNCCLGAPCDSVDIFAASDPTSADTCCYIVTIDNHYCDSTYFKGLMIQTTLPTTISQISVLNGWIINQFNSTTAAVFPPGGGAGYVGQGVQDVFRICTDNYTTNPHFVTVSWLIPSASGGVDIVCPKELVFDCAIPPTDVSCVQIVADSINCETNTYCFKVKNNSTPGFNINQILLINLTPSTAVLTGNPVPIPLLTPGQTSGWICMAYSGVVAGDNLCFNTTAHFVDTNGNALTCCTDTVGHCIAIPECGSGSCCDITQAGFDSLLQNIVLQPITPDKCEVCLSYSVDSCDVLQISFGDGSTVTHSGGNGIQCHTYAVPGIYTVTVSLIRYDDTGDTCRFAQTEFPVTVDCGSTGSGCCDISQAGFDSLLQNIVLQPINPAVCEVCLNYTLDSCDVLQLAFGDGSVITNSNSSGIQCHTYAVPGTYTVMVSLIRYDDTGDTCRFAQTEFPVTVDCGSTGSDCCNISQAGFDSLLQNIVLQPINPAVCEVCLNYTLDSCDVLQLAFGDGSVVTHSGGSGIQCHTYAVPGTYTVTVSLIRYDDTGDTCRFAQTEFPVTVDCTIPSCCNITQAAFDSLLQNIVLQPINPSVCEVCLNYSVDSCDVLQLAFGDGSVVTHSGGSGIQCHTYAVPGTYTVTVSLIRYDDTGDTCRFAQTEFPVTVDCTTPSCCNITQSAFDSLLQNIVLQPVNPSVCEVCLNYSVDSCDVLQLAFGDGSVATNIDSSGTRCHTYAVPGTYIVTVSLIRYDDTGDTCRFAQTTFPVTVDCATPDCCDITASAFDTLFQNGVSTNITDCQLCWPFELDSCDVLTVDYGNGATFNYSIGDTLCYTYDGPGGNFPVTVTYTRFDSSGNICHQRDTMFDVQVQCVITNCDAKNIKIYNAMSPDDGDNLNEVLLIENYQDCGRIDISVYNRWGQLVWQQSDYDNTWKGISQNGKPLPDGTYYLLLELPDVDERTQAIRIQTFIDIRRD